MNLNSFDKQILRNLSLWLGLPSQKIKELGNIYPEHPNDYYENILDCQSISWLEGQIRRLTHKVIKFIKERNRYQILDTIKKLRQFRRKDLIEISQCRFVVLDR